MPATPLCAAAADTLQLRSAALAFSLQPHSLAPSEWQNRLSGACLKLDGGSEIEVEVGERPEQARKVSLKLAGTDAVSASEDQATLRVRSDDGSLAGWIP